MDGKAHARAHFYAKLAILEILAKLAILEILASPRVMEKHLPSLKFWQNFKNQCSKSYAYGLAYFPNLAKSSPSRGYIRAVSRSPSLVHLRNPDPASTPARIRNFHRGVSRAHPGHTARII
jgi:hypothetical protein